MRKGGRMKNMALETVLTNSAKVLHAPVHRAKPTVCIRINCSLLLVHLIRGVNPLNPNPAWQIVARERGHFRTFQKMILIIFNTEAMRTDLFFTHVLNSCHAINTIYIQLYKS